MGRRGVGELYGYNIYEHSNVIIAMVKDLRFKSYANLNIPSTSTNFASWELHLIRVNADGSRVDEVNLGNSVLTKDTISGANFRFIINFNVPELTGACYELVIVDTADSNQIVYFTNQIEYRKEYNENDIRFIQYSNDVDIFNYGYEANPSFTNSYFLKIFMREPTPKVSQVGYTLVNGNFKPVRSTSGTVAKVIWQAIGVDDVAAANAFTLHDKAFLAFRGLFKKVTRNDAGLNVAWSDRDPLADVDIDLELSSTFTTNANE